MEREVERRQREKEEVAKEAERRRQEERGEREKEKKTRRESEEEKERKELEEREEGVGKEQRRGGVEIRRQLQETRDRLKTTGIGFEPKEADTMAAARSDDEEAAITTNDAAVVGSASATETVRERRGSMEGGGSKAEKDEGSKCEMCQKDNEREGGSRCRAGEGNKKKEDRMGWYPASASEEEDGGGEASVDVPPGIVVEREDEKEDGRRMDKLVARVQKLEERVRGMHQKMWEAVSLTGTATEEESTNWRRDGAGGEWQRWKGEWWIRVGSSNLNSRQRRGVSRNLRRLIAREQNEVWELLRELKSALWKGNESAGTCDRETQGGGSSDGRTEKNKGGDDNDDDGVRSRGVTVGRKWEVMGEWVSVESRGGPADSIEPCFHPQRNKDFFEDASALHLRSFYEHLSGVPCCPSRGRCPLPYASF